MGSDAESEETRALLEVCTDVEPGAETTMLLELAVIEAWLDTETVLTGTERDSPVCELVLVSAP
jgi:hypothetical protein